jgi:hypothetical protein
MIMIVMKIPDTFVTKEVKVYSFNNFLPKTTDYLLRRTFLMENMKHQNRFGHHEYGRYSIAKTKSKNKKRKFYRTISRGQLLI